MVELRLLGPIEARTSGERIDLGPRKQRLVLAVLALEVNRSVEVDRLIDLVWPTDPPRTSTHAIRVCISGLRSAFAGVSEVGIQTRGAGYALVADPLTIDVHQFRMLLAQAREVGDDERRIALLERALALWSGPALADAAPALTQQRLCAGLEDARLGAVEDLLDARLRLGRHQALVDELTGLVATYPLRERFCGQLMLALHRSGRNGDALAAYRGYRKSLADELGMDPGVALRELELVILRHDAAVPVPTPAVPVPAQLPAGVADFVGRANPLKELDRLLSPAGDSAIGIIGGTAGVGKTALAIHWAHRVADRFPDGQLYVNLRGFAPNQPPVTPAEAMHGFLEALGIAPERLPASTDARAALYRTLLAERRMLVLLDNARDADQVRPLLPGTGRCAVVVTSRTQLASLVAVEGAQPVSLDLLTPDESRDLLIGRLGADRVSAESDAAEEIIRRCAGLSLALVVTAAHAVINRDMPLALLTKELGTARRRLDGLTAGDLTSDVRAVFFCSYRQLSGPAGRLFRLVGIHPGAEIGLRAAASLAGTSAEAVSAVLAELTSANLLTLSAPDRFTCHDLLRAYAAELAGDIDFAGERQAALRRVLDHYLHTAHAVCYLLHPTHDPLDLPAPDPETTPEEIGDMRQAMTWLTAEHEALIAAIRTAAETPFHSYSWRLVWLIRHYLDRQAHWHDWAEAQRAALVAARRAGNRSWQADALRGLASASARLLRYEEAHTHLDEALDLFTQPDDRTGQARVHLDLCWVLGRQGQHREALHHASQALAIHRATGHRAARGNALNAVGWCHAQLGEYDQAVMRCRESLDVLLELGDPIGAAAAWDSLGYAHHHLADLPEAVRCYQEALDLRRRGGDRYYEARTLIHLADSQEAMGQPVAARSRLLEALDILRTLGHADAHVIRDRLDRREPTGGMT